MSTTDEDSSGVLRSILPPEQVDRFLGTCDDYGWALLGLGALIAASFPVLGLEGGYFMTVLSEMFLFAILALSWDIVGGQTGYPSFGNMAFFGIGAYATAILTKDFAVAFPVAFLLAGLIAVTFAAVIGIVVLRLRGHYFAIATLGVLLVAQQSPASSTSPAVPAGRYCWRHRLPRPSTTSSSASSSSRWHSSTTSPGRALASS